MAHAEDRREKPQDEEEYLWQAPEATGTASGKDRWVRLRPDPDGEFPKKGCLIPSLNPRYRFRSGDLQADAQLSAAAYQKLIRRQRDLPVETMSKGERTWWMYQERFYWEDKGYAPLEVKAILERSLDNALHPHSLAEFIGQNQTKEELREMIGTSEAEGRSLGHILICGPNGTGKKALVRALAYEMDVPILGEVGKLPARALFVLDEGHRMIAKVLSSLDHSQVLRIADVGDLDARPKAIEVLCEAMLKKKVKLSQETDTLAEEYDLSQSPFTLVATARRMSDVPEPMLVLFHRVFHLTPYSASELAALIVRGVEVLRLNAETAAIDVIADCAAGRTGLAAHLLKRSSQSASAIESDTITQGLVEEVLWRLGRFAPEAEAVEQRVISDRVRQAVLDRDQYICRYCGRRSQTMEIDHVIPVSQGGQSTLDNLVTACRSCNRKKAGRTPKEAGMDLLPVRTERRNWE